MTELHDPNGTLAQRLGRRIRTRRSELGLTLAAFSERSGVSVSYLSALEKGVNLPSLPKLVKITDALGVTIPSMLADEGVNRVRVSAAPRTRGLAQASHPDLQLEVQILRAGAGEAGEIPLETKGHDMFVYVLEGQIDLLLDGLEWCGLEAGDALDVRSPDRMSWRSNRGCCALWSSCPV